MQYLILSKHEHYLQYMRVNHPTLRLLNVIIQHTYPHWNQWFQVCTWFNQLSYFKPLQLNPIFLMRNHGIRNKRIFTWLRACLEVNVTTGICPCNSFLGKRSMTIRILASEPRDTVQNPFDCPFDLFSKNFTPKKSCTPSPTIASVTSWSVVH